MNLGKNVFNLLKRQPEVYVTGLGSFKRIHTSATYDEKQNVFLPPITYIDFDRTSEQGYDFTQYIQHLQLVDRREAEEAVASEVTDLLRRVREDGQAKLDDLGHLVSYGDSYVFKALNLSGFQYEPVEAVAGPPQPVVKEEVPEPEQQQENEPSVEEKDAAADEEIVEEKPEQEEQSAAAAIIETPEVTEEEAPASRRNTVWYVVAGVVVLGIMVALYFGNQKQPVATHGAKAGAAADSNVNQQDTATLGLAADTSTQQHTDSGQTADEGPVVPENHTWQVVIGSHRTLAQAYEQAESYNKAGFPKVRVIPSNLAKNRKKVIWDSYETKQEADSALKYVQRHHIPDAWPDKIK